MLGLNDAGEDAPKSLRRAYAYGVFLGALGAHRFYLGLGTSAATQLVLTLIGLLAVSGAGYAFLALIGGNEVKALGDFRCGPEGREPA